MVNAGGLGMRGLISFAEPVLLAVLVALQVSASIAAQPPDPVEIIDHVDRLLRGDSSRGRLEMTVVTRRWKRTLELEIWSEGTDKALIRILQPKKEEGTATLKVESDIWNYLPKIDRTIRVPSSMMAGSWMGSHFNNDDLVKDARLIRDYQVANSFDGEREGERVWEFALTPRPEAAVVWGKILFEVRQQDKMPLKAEYYDEQGELKRTLSFHDFEPMGGRLVPKRSRLEPEGKPGEFTEMIYHELQFDIPIPARMFSLANLRR